MLKVSVIAQVIKNYIFPSGGKSNDPLHIDYVPNVFKFTKIPAKRTQESLKRYEWTQKRQRRQKVKTSKIFTASYISNDSRTIKVLESLGYFDFLWFVEITSLARFYYLL